MILRSGDKDLGDIEDSMDRPLIFIAELEGILDQENPTSERFNNFPRTGNGRRNKGDQAPSSISARRHKRMIL